VGKKFKDTKVFRRRNSTLVTLVQSRLLEKGEVEKGQGPRRGEYTFLGKSKGSEKKRTWTGGGPGKRSQLDHRHWFSQGEGHRRGEHPERVADEKKDAKKKLTKNGTRNVKKCRPGETPSVKSRDAPGKFGKKPSKSAQRAPTWKGNYSRGPECETQNGHVLTSEKNLRNSTSRNA